MKERKDPRLKLESSALAMEKKASRHLRCERAEEDGGDNVEEGERRDGECGVVIVSIRWGSAVS